MFPALSFPEGRPGRPAPPYAARRQDQREFPQQDIAPCHQPQVRLRLVSRHLFPEPLRPAQVLPTALVAAAAAPVVQAMLPPVRRPGDSARNDSAAGGFNGEIHVHLHNVVTQNPRELAKTVGEMVKAELDRLTRAGRGSFRDTD